LLETIGVVRTEYRAVFEFVPEGPEAAPGPELDFRGDDPEPAGTIAALTMLGFRDGTRVVATVRGWLSGHVRALRSSRARDLIGVMVPAILAALARQSNPDEAFRRFGRLIGALPTGVQPMSLFQRNPLLLERIATVLGAAPLLSEHLALYPGALEGLLTPEEPVPVRRMLRGRLADARGLEDSIRIAGQAVKERDFFLSVATLEGRLDADAAGRQRAALAEAAIGLLVPAVLADFSTRFGTVPGGSLAVVAMGKAGGREMMAGSDLDLIFVYDHPPEVSESTGARAMPAGQWFVRAVSACVAALTAPGPEGRMYALDMRLRPSGNKGPLAVSLASFRLYHETEAWTWERMALTRARVVAGPMTLRRDVQAAIDAGVRRDVPPDAVMRDVLAMRARMERELRPHGPWDVKLRPGGLVDLEFVAQALQLVHPRAKRSQTTRVALRGLASAGVLAREDARVLIQAEGLWRTIQGMLRMTVGQVDGAILPVASAGLLLDAVRAVGIEVSGVDGLLGVVDGTAARVRGLFERYIRDVPGATYPG
jgi:glutamate-ammonia-ligase adenylyltransferase